MGIDERLWSAGAGWWALMLALVVSLSGATAVALPDAPASAVDQGAVHAGDSRVESRLLVDVEQVAPGESFRVGVAFRLDPSWHIYWQNPGDAGVPTDIEWSSDSVSFGPLQWAAPASFSEEVVGLTTYGYVDEVVLFSEATVADDAAGEFEVTAKVDYLACSDLCLPGHSRLSREIAVGSERIDAAPEVTAAMDQAGSRVPRRAVDLGLETAFHYSQAPLRSGDEVEVAVEVIACREVEQGCPQLRLADGAHDGIFVSDAGSRVDLKVLSASGHPDAASGVVLRLGATLPEGAPPARPVVSGVARLERVDGTAMPVFLRDEPAWEAAGAEIAQTPLPSWATHDEGAEVLADIGDAGTDGEADEPMSLVWALLMAFLGGMVLNLMPCVFPVLALKVSSFTQLVHESRQGILAHGMAYTGGIVGSMLALAAVVLGLRIAGTHVGWGFQFQQPHFLAVLVVILVLFALNLFGVFEVSFSPQSLHGKAVQSHGVKRSFWEGILAVALATPCSAPFMGTAVGFALASDAWTVVAVFASLGLGLAAPMVVLALMPGWTRLLPKPGDWMVHLKKFLGFALLGSAIWIVWLLGRQTGVDGMAAMLIFAGVLGLATWLFGLVQFQAWSRRKVVVLLVAAAVVGAGAAVAFPLKVEKRAPKTVVVSEEIDWQPWSEEAVAAALDEGRPVFVDFTADWCLTCQVNEENAVNTPAVREAIARYEVAVFKADWTQPDEKIRLKLAEFKRAAIPFYLVYSPERPEKPKTLEDVITAQGLVDAFAEAAEE